MIQSNGSDLIVSPVVVGMIVGDSNARDSQSSIMSPKKKDNSNIY